MDYVRPVLRADWEEALFIHLAVDAAALSRVVPFELDLWDGRACVSLVAFTQNHLRPTYGGRIAALLSRPLARHAFLNLRTYVRVDGEPAIFFIAEWIPNRLAVLLGPRLYGLPYRIGSLCYRRDDGGADETRLAGRVAAAGGCLQYRARAPHEGEAHEATPGSADAFFLERYVAWTHRTGVSRRFHVAHVPWPQVRARVEIIERTLLTAQGEWLRDAVVIGANYSRGVRDVDISAPEVVHHVVAAERQ